MTWIKKFLWRKFFEDRIISYGVNNIIYKIILNVPK